MKMDGVRRYHFHGKILATLRHREKKGNKDNCYEGHH
jgi:hypothetical protein